MGLRILCLYANDSDFISAMMEYNLHLFVTQYVALPVGPAAV